MNKHIVIDARIRRASTGRPIARLLEHLQEIDPDNRYTVLLEPTDVWQPKKGNFHAITCRYKQFSFNPLQQISFAWFLYRLKPDLVHFTMTGQQPLFYFGKQATMTHDLTMYRYVRAGKLPKALHWLRMLGYRLLMWSAHRKAKRIIVPTDFVKEDVMRKHRFTKNKLVRTYEASEPPLKAKAKPLKDIEKPFVLYVGSAFPHKNLEGLVLAFERLNERHPELSLVLVGKREYHSKQLEQDIADSPAIDNITFTGFVSDEELKWLYKNAATYVFPSFSEGFGLPGLEAMVHGCPVVSSNATCLPEVYGDAAEYFDPYDIEDMTVALEKVVYNEGMRESLIETGYEQADKYSWRSMTEQTLVVYESIL